MRFCLIFLFILINFPAFAGQPLSCDHFPKAVREKRPFLTLVIDPIEFSRELHEKYSSSSLNAGQSPEVQAILGNSPSVEIRNHPATPIYLCAKQKDIQDSLPSRLEILSSQAIISPLIYNSLATSTAAGKTEEEQHLENLGLRKKFTRDWIAGQQLQRGCKRKKPNNN